MLSESEIQNALHADRVVPLGVVNPHGPLGLEQLAATVAGHQRALRNQPATARIQRSIELPLQTWEKLSHLASTTRVSPGELAAAIIEQYVTTETT